MKNKGGLLPKIKKQQEKLKKSVEIIKISIDDLNNNKINLEDGEYDFIIKNDNSNIIIMFNNTKKNINIGHSSLVNRENYKKEFDKWNKNKIEINSEKDEIKFAGEIKIKNKKFIKWTDKSGHYLPLKKEAKKINLDKNKYERCKIPKIVENGKRGGNNTIKMNKRINILLLFLSILIYILINF